MAVTYSKVITGKSYKVNSMIKIGNDQNAEKMAAAMNVKCG